MIETVTEKTPLVAYIEERLADNDRVALANRMGSLFLVTSFFAVWIPLVEADPDACWIFAHLPKRGEAVRFTGAAGEARPDPRPIAVLDEHLALAAECLEVTRWSYHGEFGGSARAFRRPASPTSLVFVDNGYLDLVLPDPERLLAARYNPAKSSIVLDTHDHDDWAIVMPVWIPLDPVPPKRELDESEMVPAVGRLLDGD